MKHVLSMLLVIVAVTPSAFGQEVFLQDGAVKGRISTVAVDGERPVSGLRMKLIRRGMVVQTATTNSQGVFELRGIGPGNYSLAGSGGSGFIATGFTVGDDDRDPNAAFSRDGFQIDTLAIPPTFRTLTRILRENYGSARQPRLGTYESVLFDSLVRRTKRQANARQVSKLSQQPEDRQPPADSADDLSQRNQEVQLDTEGNLQGYVRVHDGIKGDLSSLTVYVVRRDYEVGRSLVATDGSFKIAKIPGNGAYGLIVAGEMGFGAYQIKIVGGENQSELPLPADAVVAPKNRNIRLVANRANIANSLQVGLMSAQDTQAFIDSLPNGTNIGGPAQSPAGQTPDGGTEGGGGGGSGGSSPGGGLGSLVGLSGLAGLAAFTDRASPE